jgi:FHS family L-fucose permease-like MFS transporter
LCRKELDGLRETKIGYVDGDGVEGDPDHELSRSSLSLRSGGLRLPELRSSSKKE